MENIKDFLNSIGIYKEGNFKDKQYIIDISNSNEFGKYYSILNKSDLVNEDIEVSTVNVENSNIKFNSDDFDLTLIADFNNSIYKLIVEENWERLI